MLLYDEITISPGGTVYFHLFSKEKWIETFSHSDFYKYAMKDNLTLIANACTPFTDPLWTQIVHAEVEAAEKGGRSGSTESSTLVGDIWTQAHF